MCVGIRFSNKKALVRVRPTANVWGGRGLSVNRLTETCLTRKHSNRMRTVCCSDCRGGRGGAPAGGNCPGGCTCPGGVLPTGGCTCPGGVTYRGCTCRGVCAPACENITFPQLRLRTVKITFPQLRWRAVIKCIDLY